MATKHKYRPGELVKDEMEARGWSIETMVERSQLRRDTVEEIISGTRRVTLLTAVCLANAFGTSTEIWLNLQESFDGK